MGGRDPLPANNTYSPTIEEKTGEKVRTISLDQRKKISLSVKRAMQSPELRERISSGVSLYFATHRPIERRPNPNKGKPNLKVAEALKHYLKTTSHRLNLSLSLRQHWANPESNPMRQHISERARERWQDPEFATKMAVSWQRKPTKPENQLRAILNSHFPEFQYNGDGRLGIILAGLIPDFVNVNGKKQVIEVFGDYWHSPKINRKWHQTELGRILAYHSVGFDCLVLWEHEMDKLQKGDTIEKITKFTKGGVS